MASFDVIFLGGGPAGYVGALRSAQLGLSVAVVEREGLGGTCVLWGCIPAKALLESAAVAHRARQAKTFGVNVGEITTDYNVAMKRSRAVSTQNSKGVEFLFKKNKITWLLGTGTLTGRKSVSVADAKGVATTHEAKKAIVICTGSRVKGIPAIGLTLDKKNILSSDEVLILEKAPATMAIVGCGAVGCEFADVFHEFGTKVTMLETMPTMLPLEDAEVAAELARSFKKRGIEVVLEREDRAGKGWRRLGHAVAQRPREEGAHLRKGARRHRSRAERRGDRPRGAGSEAHRSRLHQDRRANADERGGHLRDR